MMKVWLVRKLTEMTPMSYPKRNPVGRDKSVARVLAKMIIEEYKQIKRTSILVQAVII